MKYLYELGRIFNGSFKGSIDQYTLYLRHQVQDKPRRLFIYFTHKQTISLIIIGAKYQDECFMLPFI